MNAASFCTFLVFGVSTAITIIYLAHFRCVVAMRPALPGYEQHAAYQRD